MDDLNPWETLGVAPGVSPVEIRRAYRRLARRYHPDLNPGDPDAAERFKAIQAAYEALTGGRGGAASQDAPSQAGGEPQRHVFSADDDPFLSILDAYLRRRRGADQ